jgi:hypothetical protein
MLFLLLKLSNNFWEIFQGNRRGLKKDCKISDESCFQRSCNAYCENRIENFLLFLIE